MIEIKCDVCGAVIEMVATNGVTEATRSLDNLEKRCGGCGLEAQLAGWPAEFAALKKDYRTVKIPELKNFFIANLRQGFRKFAEARAQAYFGAQFDAAMPTIKDDVLALSNLPVTVTVQIGE
jgi:hypothetical protein